METRVPPLHEGLEGTTFEENKLTLDSNKELKHLGNLDKLKSEHGTTGQNQNTNKSRGLGSVTSARNFIGDANGEKPKGVSDSMWKKFQVLHKRREDILARSKLKRQREFQKKLKHESQQNKSVDEPPEKKSTEPDKDEITKTPDTNETSSASGVESWSDIKPYLHCKDHLKGIDPGRYAPKTKLENEVDAAISQGQYTKAEQLSDHMANREFGSKVAEAFQAKKYAEEKQKEDQLKKERERKKLNWGFAEKQRWERKSNM
ncbi:unnamed protein product [Owenia fusiformis]|uniref:Uncharacterized protein n=1 Tax=Owenia fusiformis TaxID=6347 RepID=A0A8J1T4L9_OWEFU|nr:unnamed protein product [Owenia fusiformis]